MDDHRMDRPADAAEQRERTALSDYADAVAALEHAIASAEAAGFSDTVRRLERARALLLPEGY